MAQVSGLKTRLSEVDPQAVPRAEVASTMGIALLQLRSWLSFVLPDHDDDDGTSVVEYALLLALIAVVALIAVGFVGDPVSEGLSAGGQGFAAN
jgi:Flp pilus assembly pilin Flp